MSTTLSKGERLEPLLKQGETLHHQMRLLFLKNGLTTPIVKSLPLEDQAEWLRLKGECNQLTTKICQTINE